MRTSWRIFTIFGIEIRIDSSWLFIFALVTWALARALSPTVSPLAPDTIWIVGLVTSLLLFSSVLAHELTHSLVARSKGKEVRSITLFFFGGVAEISQRARDAGHGIHHRRGRAGSRAVLIAVLFFGVWHAMQGISEPIAATRPLSLHHQRYPRRVQHDPRISPRWGEGAAGHCLEVNGKSQAGHADRLRLRPGHRLSPYLLRHLADLAGPCL